MTDFKLGNSGNISSNFDLNKIKAGMDKKSMKNDLDKSLFDIIDKDGNGVISEKEATNFKEGFTKSAANHGSASTISEREANEWIKQMIQDNKGDAKTLEKLKNLKGTELLNALNSFKGQDNIKNASDTQNGNHTVVTDNNGTTKIYNKDGSYTEMNNGKVTQKDKENNQIGGSDKYGLYSLNEKGEKTYNDGGKKYTVTVDQNGCWDRQYLDKDGKPTQEKQHYTSYGTLQSGTDADGKSYTVKTHEDDGYTKTYTEGAYTELSYDKNGKETGGVWCGKEFTTLHSADGSNPIHQYKNQDGTTTLYAGDSENTTNRSATINKDGTITTAPIEGKTVEETMTEFGITSAEDKQAFLDANKGALKGHPTWFDVSDNITIPKSITDKMLRSPAMLNGLLVDQLEQIKSWLGEASNKKAQAQDVTAEANSKPTTQEAKSLKFKNGTEVTQTAEGNYTFKKGDNVAELKLNADGTYTMTRDGRPPQTITVDQINNLIAEMRMTPKTNQEI